jgi:transglutaminase-like putative cysteine protease
VYPLWVWTRTENIPNSLVGIPRGVPGTLATLRLMEQLADEGSRDPIVRGWALAAVAGAPPHDHAAELAALHQRARDGIAFRRDHVAMETLQTARRTLEWMAGDCDDFSILLAAALRSIGFPARLAFRVIGKQAGAYGHVYVVARLGNREIPLDAIHRETPFGWQYPNPAMKGDYALWGG